MTEVEKSCSGVRVCVTGGAGFIGSWLVKKLIDKGYTVHATLRNTGDEEKVELLRGLVPGAAERLRLFEADLFDAATFAPAIAGCQFVFLVATPYGFEAASSKYKSTAEAAVAAVREILRQCEEAKTVRRAGEEMIWFAVFDGLNLFIRTEAVARVEPAGDKLSELGFRYEDGMDEILDSSVACAARLGSLDAAKLRLQKG